MRTASERNAGPLDLHVHLVGNGLQGSGCRLQTRLWFKPFAGLMARSIGLNASLSSPAFDQAYVEALLHWIRDSSLSAAVILACDDVHDDQGKPRPDLSTLFVPNNYVLKIAADHPELLAGVSIHPARPDALDELERCVESGAVLLKILPSVQIIDPAQERFRRFWQRAAELGLPVLAHTGGEFSLTTYRRDLENPACLTSPLEAGMNVIAAHCGSPAMPWDRDYWAEFARLRERYSNFYGDLSALSQPIHLNTLARLRDDPRRVFYGSDYPVLSTAVWARLRHWISAGEFHWIRRLKNPLEKKYQLTRALGFPEEVFIDAWKLLRKVGSAGSRAPGRTWPSPDCDDRRTAAPE